MENRTQVEAKFTSYLEMVAGQNASDLHLCVGRPPILRIDGKLYPIAGEGKISEQAMIELSRVILNEEQRFMETLDNGLKLLNENLADLKAKGQKEIPGELIESARVDGAGHVSIFTRIMLPLMAPAIAAFGIFQFLWVWNDLLVALVFLGGTSDVAVLTQRLANMVGSRGQDWHLLTAGAFVAMIVPLAVFFGLQRYFVQGLMAGSVKG